MTRLAKDHIDDPAAVGARLRERRLAIGLTQGDLTFPGCSTAYISRIESGDRIPSLQVIRKLAVRLDVRESWLAKGLDKLEPDDELLTAELELRLGEVDDAERRYRLLLGESTTSRVRARAEAGLGQVAAQRGRPADAIEHFETAVALAPLADASDVEALGRTYALVGRDAEALAVFRARFDRAEDEGDVQNLVRFGVLLANALIDGSAFVEATTILSRVLQLFDVTNDNAMARVRWSLARLHALRGEREEARREAIAALTLLETSENRLQYARAHHLLAFVELDSGHPEDALTLAERGQELLGSEATDYDRATFDIERARAFAQLGRPDEAASLAMTAAGSFSGLHPVDLGRAYTEIAAAFHQRGDRARARELLELAIDLLSSRPPTRFLAEAYSRFGALLEDDGDAAGALAAYRSGAQLAEQI